MIGKIKHEPTGKVLREISGTWSNEMFISKPKVCYYPLFPDHAHATTTNNWHNLFQTSQKTSLFDVKSSKILPPLIQPESQQELNESRRYVHRWRLMSDPKCGPFYYRLWSKVTLGIKQNDMDLATDAKLAVEERQRADTRQREDRGLVFEPRFFALDEKDGEYKIKLQG